MNSAGGVLQGLFDDVATDPYTFPFDTGASAAKDLPRLWVDDIHPDLLQHTQGLAVDLLDLVI